MVPEGNIAKRASVIGILGHVVEGGVDVGHLSLNQRLVAYGDLHMRAILCQGGWWPRRDDNGEQCEQHYAEADQ